MRHLLVAISCFPLIAFAQGGGRLSYALLDYPQSARNAALSGSVVSLTDGDVSQFFTNPATLDSTQTGDVFVHINPFFLNTSLYSLATSFSIKQIDGFGAGIAYFNYGSFDLTDPTGQLLGEFSASDYALTLGKSHRLGPFALGVNLKFIHSSIESYSSSAMAFDLGGTFQLNKSVSVGLVLAHMGIVISDFSERVSHSLPFDLLIGASFKPNYMPIRFTLTSNQLARRNGYERTEELGSANRVVEKILKKINVGVEIVLNKHFQLLFGYNHKRKQEMKFGEIGGGAGLSYGMMIKVKQIEVRFSRASYSIARGTSHISIQTNLKNFRKNKSIL